MPRIAPVRGSMVTVPTRLRSGRSSGSSSTAATVFSWIEGSIVEITVKPPVLISSAVNPCASSSLRTVASRYPSVPPWTLSLWGSMVSGNSISSASWAVSVPVSLTCRSTTRVHSWAARSGLAAGSYAEGAGITATSSAASSSVNSEASLSKYAWEASWTP